MVSTAFLGPSCSKKKLCKKYVAPQLSNLARINPKHQRSSEIRGFGQYSVVRQVGQDTTAADVSSKLWRLHSLKTHGKKAKPRTTMGSVRRVSKLSHTLNLCRSCLAKKEKRRTRVGCDDRRWKGTRGWEKCAASQRTVGVNKVLYLLSSRHRTSHLTLVCIVKMDYSFKHGKIHFWL
jgi:hypothetical protein